jgi:glycosyltransferase involved in cell wall biosynthesis
MKPIRVLHVLGRLAPGGVETWLLHVMRTVDRSVFHFDFLLHDATPSAYDEEIRGLGSQLHYCTSIRNPIKYAATFLHTVCRYGPYNTVHSHVHHYSGFVLMLAHRAGTSQRIAHSHNDTRRLEQTASWPRLAYLRQCQYWLRTHSTDRIAASHPAGESLFGNTANFSVLYCGVDLTRFHMSAPNTDIRQSLGIRPDELVLGHIGRFDPQKNHSFLLDVTRRIMAQAPNTRLILVGDGQLKSDLIQRARSLGILDRVVFAGARADIPALLSAMDVFLFPSQYEGLGLALVEAQVAGLPVITSRNIPTEAFWRPELITLADPLNCEEWSGAAISSRGKRWPVKTDNCPFDIHASVAKLSALYAKTYSTGH